MRNRYANFALSPTPLWGGRVDVTYIRNGPDNVTALAGKMMLAATNVGSYYETRSNNKQTSRKTLVQYLERVLEIIICI